MAGRAQWVAAARGRGKLRERMRAVHGRTGARSTADDGRCHEEFSRIVLMKRGVIAAYELDRSALGQHGIAAFTLLVAVSASRLGSLSLCCRAAVWVPHPLGSNGRLPVAVRAPAGGRGRPGGGGPRREGLLRRAPRRRDVALAGARADNRVGPRLRVAGEDLDRRGDGELRPALAGRGAARVHGERLRHRGPADRHERARHLAGRVRARAPRGRRAKIRGQGPRRLPGDGPGRAHGRGRGLLGRRRRRRGRVRAALGRFTPHRRGDDGHRLPDGRRAGRRSASDDYVRPATEKSRRSP